VKHEIDKDNKFRPFNLKIESKAEIDYLIRVVGSRSGEDEEEDGIDDGFALGIYSALIAARDASIGE
jgi:hypothetical protein